MCKLHVSGLLTDSNGSDIVLQKMMLLLGIHRFESMGYGIKSTRGKKLTSPVQFEVFMKAQERKSLTTLTYEINSGRVSKFK